MVGARAANTLAGDSQHDTFVSIADLGFQYARNLPRVLHGIDLEIAEGEFFVLLGPSGCGKTTVLTTLAGFEKPTIGSIQVSGVPVKKPGPDRVVIFQGDDSLLGWLTVEQNVEFGLKVMKMPKSERTERVREVLKMVELDKNAKKYPHQLSGGMKQRVQIARALVTDAPVLLMDEPFGALDSQTRTVLQDELARIWAESRRTVLFITHDISEALILGDRIGIMTSGPDATLHQVLTNDLPRPRDRGAAKFAEWYHLVESTVAEAKAARG